MTEGSPIVFEVFFRGGRKPFPEIRLTIANEMSVLILELNPVPNCHRKGARAEWMGRGFVLAGIAPKHAPISAQIAEAVSPDRPKTCKAYPTFPKGAET